MSIRTSAVICVLSACLTASGLVAMARADRIFATNLGSVHEYDESGQLVRTYSPATIRNAAGIAVDSRGNVYIGQASTVWRYRPGNDIPEAFASLSYPVDIEVASDDTLFVSDFTEGSISHFDQDGNLLATPLVNQVNLTGIDIDSNGNLLAYVRDSSGGGTVERITPAGDFLQSIKVNTAPNFLALDDVDNIYVQGGKGDMIDRFLPDGTYAGIYLSDVAMPFGLDFDSAGRLYVAQYVGPVRRYNTDGSLDDSFSLPVSGFNVYVHRGVSVPEPNTGLLAIFGVGVMLRKFRGIAAR